MTRFSKTFVGEMALQTGERLGMRCASPERTSNVDVGVAEMKIMRSSRLEESARECGRAHQSERCARQGENLGW